MSYDLSIWCIQPFVDETDLPDSEKWTRRGSAWSIEGKGWILNSGPSDRVLPEDIPDEVVGLLPGIEHVVHLSLQPIHAPNAGFTTLGKVAKVIAKTARGVVLDPQKDSVELPSGIKRYVPAKREKEARVSLLELSWWFEHANLLERGSIGRLLDIFAAHLPEALPRRYGLYEPPQHELEKTGRTHLIEFLADHLTESVVWYAHRPVAYVFISIQPSCGWQRLGARHEYRCNRVSLEIDADALDQPGWQAALNRLWRALSTELRPFFGDVRTLKGYFRRGPHVSSDGATEHGPTKSWWWKGIPPRLGHAVVLGPPYLRSWPEFANGAELVDGLAFAATGDWRSQDDVADAIGGVPAKLALPFMPHQSTDEFGGRQTVYAEDYPALFPFGPRLT